ncbi:MAG TPA: site-specific integrase [Trichocoleus sp.]
MKKKVLQVTTVGQAREVITKLSAACDWARRKRLLQANPYEGLAREMPRPRYAVESKPNAFTPQEKEAVLTAFATDTRPGLNFRRYRPLVEFWFLTGCRPSEGIGLQWKHVAPDYSHVKFEGSLTTAGGSPVPIRVMGSKTNKMRQFPCSPKLKELLQSIKPESANPEDLVFPSPRGGGINYTNFATKIWGKVVDPIKPDTTPYCCRDTFITTQIINGVQESIIAYWCDNSVEVIQKHYADFIKMSQITPTDY